MTQSPACPACGGSFGTRVPYPASHDARFALRFEEIEICGKCGLGAALPRYAQTELDSFYAAGTYWNDTVGRSSAQRLHERNQCRHRVERAALRLSRRAGLRVLDVGAGHGWTAYWLDRMLPAALARFEFVEPDADCSREILARRTRFATARVATLADAEPGYDLVFLNHVLEHVADPLDAVERICALLAPAGVAYFEVPYADQRFKSDVFPHTWFFTPAALGALATRAGAVEMLREAFGRLPSSMLVDVAWRALYRASAALGLDGAAGFCDDRMWRYAMAADGIWLRWMLARS